MLSKIRALLPNLTPTEAQAAQHLMDDPRRALHATISELALA